MILYCDISSHISPYYLAYLVLLLFFVFVARHSNLVLHSYQGVYTNRWLIHFHTLIFKSLAIILSNNGLSASCISKTYPSIHSWVVPNPNFFRDHPYLPLYQNLLLWYSCFRKLSDNIYKNSKNEDPEQNSAITHIKILRSKSKILRIQI